MHLHRNINSTDRERSFADLLQSCSAIIHKVCYMYAADNDTRADLRQEIYANIWEGLPYYRRDAQMQTWVYRVAINTCITYHRRTRRHSNNVPLDQTNEPVYLECYTFEQRQMLEYLHSLIQGLPDVDKAIIMLWLDDYSYDEIANLTGLSRNNVASRIHRIKLRLSNKAKTEI